jgi:hypothetical protein
MTNYINRVQASKENGSILQNFNGVSTSDSLLYTKTIRVTNEIVGSPRYVNDPTTSVLANTIVDTGIPLTANGKTFIILEVVGSSSGLDPVANGIDDSLVVLVTNPSSQVDATGVTAYHILNAVGNNLIMPWHITLDNIDALCNLDMGIGLAGSGRYYDVRVSVSYTRP